MDSCNNGLRFYFFVFAMELNFSSTSYFSQRWREGSQDEEIKQPISAKQRAALARRSRHRRNSHLTVAMALPVCRRLSVKAAVFDKDIVCQDDSLFCTRLNSRRVRESERESEKASADVLLYESFFFSLFIFFPLFSLFAEPLERSEHMKVQHGGQ